MVNPSSLSNCQPVPWGKRLCVFVVPVWLNDVGLSASGVFRSRFCLTLALTGLTGPTRLVAFPFFTSVILRIVPPKEGYPFPNFCSNPALFSNCIPVFDLWESPLHKFSANQTCPSEFSPVYSTQPIFENFENYIKQFGFSITYYRSFVTSEGTGYLDGSKSNLRFNSYRKSRPLLANSILIPSQCRYL